MKGKLFVNIEIKGGEKIYPGIIDELVKETESFGRDRRENKERIKRNRRDRRENT